MEPPKNTTKTSDPSAKPRSRTSARRASAPAARASAGKTALDEALATQAALGLIRSATSALESGDVAAAPISTNLVSELNNIDFKKMIGGPLQAAVDAQVASSLATVNFINAVGFTDSTTPGGPRQLVMVDFSHTRDDGTLDANGAAIPPKSVVIKVPLLAMLPIPSLRIEHVIIDFNVKLNSVETSTVSTSLGVDASVSGGWGPVNFKVSASYQRKAATGVEVKKEYALNVNVKAVQDEIPAGLEKILNMLAA
jgi:hypothetical protein